MGADVSAVVAIIDIIGRTGGTSIGILVLSFFVIPPLLAFLSVRIVSKALYALRDQIASSDAKTEMVLNEFKHRYDNNIVFIENYEKTAGDLSDIIHRNTMVMTRLVDRIDAARKG